MKLSDKIFSDDNKLMDLLEWLDYLHRDSEWLIIRIVTTLLFGCIILPLVLSWIVFLNIEFFLSKLIYRKVIKIESWQSSHFDNEIGPWLKESYSWYKWNYSYINDWSIPLVFKNYFIDHQFIYVRFLTKEEQFLFELTWKGRIKYRT